MKMMLKKLPAMAAVTLAAALAMGSTAAQAQDKTITLCWAAWDPANEVVKKPVFRKRSPYPARHLA